MCSFYLFVEVCYTHVLTSIVISNLKFGFPILRLRVIDDLLIYFTLHRYCLIVYRYFSLTYDYIRRYNYLEFLQNDRPYVVSFY